MNAKPKSPMSFRPEPDIAAMLEFVREDGLIMGKIINKALRDALTARGYGKRRAKASK